MAWENTLLEAKFRGVVFDVVKTDDDFSRAIVEHSYPYVNGSDIEDMGRGARKISVEAIFFGDDYETRLDTFLNLLDQPGAGEFIHPVFGSIKNAQPVRYPVHHDAENPDQATLTIEFIESTPSNPFFDPERSAKLNSEAIAAKSALAKAAAVDKFKAVIDAMHAASPMAGLQKLRQAITGPILAAMDMANVVLSNLDVLSYPRAWASDFTTLINGALDIRAWGQQLETDWASIKSSFSLWDLFITPSANAPAQVDSTSANPPSEVQAIAATQATLAVFKATALADAVTLAFAALADAQNTPNSPAPLLTPDAIEEMSNTTRAAIAAAIVHASSVYTMEDSRAITEPLKDLALAIQSAAAALIDARPPLVQRRITAPGNMRLVAHQLYLDHTRATELYRLNGARSPFVLTGEVINAFAS